MKKGMRPLSASYRQGYLSLMAWMIVLSMTFAAGIAVSKMGAIAVTSKELLAATEI